MNAAPEPYSLAILYGLNHGKTAPHIYGGTVPGHVKAQRRAANKVARQSRRINRGR